MALPDISQATESEGANFWELSAMSVSLLQMIFYLYMMYQYQNKLREYAKKTHGWAKDDEHVYKELRELDIDFYDYYLTLPDYEVCESNVVRNKGASFSAYGETLRSTNRTTRGYTPMKKVHINHMVANKQKVISSTALARSNILIAERRRKDAHIIERWNAIINTPIGVESYSAGAMGQVIKESFTSMQSFGQGFNSAGAAFGTQLYKVL